MAQLEIRDLFLNPSTPDAPPKWDTVTLDLDVDAGDYRVIRSKVGRKIIYIIKYEMREDPAFQENPDSPIPLAEGEIRKRWNKMYRCHFDLKFARSEVEGAPTSPVSNEENVTYPQVFPEVISMQPAPEGATWPKDPFYRLYKNYKHSDPTPPTNLKKCDEKYVAKPHIFIQQLVTALTIVDVEQKIRPPNETPPPNPPEGQEESEAETAKRLKNYLKLHDIKDLLRADYKILNVQEFQPEGNTAPVCSIKKTETKKIALRGLNRTEENKDEVDIVDLIVARF